MGRRKSCKTLRTDCCSDWAQEKTLDDLREIYAKPLGAAREGSFPLLVDALPFKANIIQYGLRAVDCKACPPKTHLPVFLQNPPTSTRCPELAETLNLLGYPCELIIRAPKPSKPKRTKPPASVLKQLAQTTLPPSPPEVLPSTIDDDLSHSFATVGVHSIIYMPETWLVNNRPATRWLARSGVYLEDE